MQTRYRISAVRSNIVVSSLLGVVLALLAPLPALAQNSTSTKWALLIGVSTYESKDITPLAYPSADVRAVKGALVRYAGFPKDNVFVMTSESPKDGPDYPTNLNITDRLAVLKRLIKTGDTFVFYFSGHGFEDTQAYLGTVNARITNHSSLTLSTLSVDTLQDALSDLPASQFILVFDACRRNPYANGSKDGTTGVRTPGQTRDLVHVAQTAGGGKARTAIFFSCEEGTRSYEDPSLKQGVFTHFFLEGLASAPRETSASLLTGDSLGEYLHNALARWSASHPQQPQIPEYRQFGTRLVLATGTYLSPNTEAYRSSAAYKAAMAAYDAYVAAPVDSAARRAVPLLLPFAEEGDSQAQYRLGRTLADAPSTQTEAVQWYRKAADQGNAIAQANLGYCYAKGQGVPKDYAQAVHWYRKAAEQGYSKAKDALRRLGY